MWKTAEEKSSKGGMVLMANVNKVSFKKLGAKKISAKGTRGIGSLVLAHALLVNCAFAQDDVITLQSTVSGSQEQPRVMYIVPWQEPNSEGFDYELHNSVAQELFSPLDRDEFVRALTLKHRRTTSREANSGPHGSKIGISE